jgi:large subunit ribosomal protein L3
MPAAILGRKFGMTRYFTEDGKNLPVTVIAAGPCVVTQVKTTESDGYAAVQLAYDDVKPRRSTMPMIGHDAAAGTTPKRHHREIRFTSDKAVGDFTLGQTVDVSAFEAIKFVDVIGTSKGKGFQGSMKRHNFKGMFASHGNERMHRHGGSIGSHATDRGHGAKIKKGKRMPGHLGAERVTMRSLDVVSIDPESNLILVKGPVPGPNNGLVYIREASRLYKKKVNVLKKADK